MKCVTHSHIRGEINPGYLLEYQTFVRLYKGRKTANDDLVN